MSARWQRRHRIGRSSTGYLPGGRPPYPPEEAAAVHVILAIIGIGEFVNKRLFYVQKADA